MARLFRVRRLGSIWRCGDSGRPERDQCEIWNDAKVIEANPRVVDDYGRVAVQRGPLVYCLEQLDQPDGVQLFDVFRRGAEGRRGVSREIRKDWQRDRGVETCWRSWRRPGSRDALYRSYSTEAAKGRQVELGFVPYYAWANRAGTPMRVWTPVVKA